MVRRRPLSYHITLKLIKEVQKHSCIWNKDSEHFNDRYYVGLAWQTIALRLQLPEETVKLKWKSLRDSFNREIKKNPASLTKYTGTWEFFNEMTFIYAHDKLDYVADITEEYLEICDEDTTTDLELEDEKPDSYYDLLFLESLTPYFKQLEPARKLAMRSKIQKMLEEEISLHGEENKDLVYVDPLETSDMTD